MPQADKYRYRNASSHRLYVRDLGLVVESLGEFDSPYEINDGNFELVKSSKVPDAATAPVKED